MDRPGRGRNQPADLPWLLLVTVSGGSMVPALRPGDRLLALRVSSQSTSPLRPGAVVLAEWVSRPGLLAVKRVVRPTGEGFWVEGDNPAESDDSRMYGAATVRARVLVRCWPWPPRIRATVGR